MSHCPDANIDIFVSLSTNTERNLMTFVRRNYYHQHMNCLHFGRNSTRNNEQDMTENSNRRQTGAAMQQMRMHHMTARGLKLSMARLILINKIFKLSFYRASAY